MMALRLTDVLLGDIHRQAESSYPEECAGLLLGSLEGEDREVGRLLPLENRFDAGARRNRYLIDSRDMLLAEQESEALGMEILGVYHSHPDHPPLPSEFDRDWALPWYSYLITSVARGRAIESRSWRLAEDRSSFTSEELVVRERSFKKETR